MANRSLQNPSSVSEKKPSRLPIFRTVIPRNSIIGCTVAPTNPKLASQNVPIRSRTGTFSGNKLPSLDQRKEDVIKSNERIPEKSIPQKSFLPVRCNNNTTCKIREPARSQISYVQQRARTQVKAKPELRQPSITSQRKESKPGQGTLSLKLSRQRTFAGDASESTNTSPESKSQKHSKESALLSLPQSTDHPILPTCEGSKSPSCTLNSSVQSKINENEANNREGSAVEMIPEGSDLNAVENCYFHQEGQINTDCTKQESNIQEKLPKSAGYVQKEREDDSFFITNSSHYISTKNTSRYSYTMKTHSIGSPGVENNSSADRESKSLEKVTSSIKIGIIETKSPSLMESSDSSDLEAIELLNNCHFFHVPDSVNDIYAYLEYQKSSLVKESGIANIKTPTLQSSEEVVSKTMEKLCNMYPSSSSIKNMQLETNSLTRLGNNESADCDEERLREVLEDDWVIVNKAEGATIINPPSSQEVDDSPNNANDKTYVTSTNET
ncbi:unnamed protein product [Allacma fusca]|uniref:Uncharacterized protein n=1 Tax=Allacma fusca TaxID=39272 RepID=A0A8J2LKM7_9HEXA|nr:unnamed protein product [Allacma fusca]